MSNILTAKAVLDWSNLRVKKFDGSKLSNPIRYKNAEEDYNLAKENYDTLCKDYIRRLKPGNKIS